MGGFGVENQIEMRGLRQKFGRVLCLLSLLCFEATATQPLDSLGFSSPLVPRNIHEALVSLEQLLERDAYQEWRARSNAYQLVVLSEFDVNNTQFYPFRLLFPPWSAKLESLILNDSLATDAQRLAWEVTRTEFRKNKSSSLPLDEKDESFGFAALAVSQTTVLSAKVLWGLSILFTLMGFGILIPMIVSKRNQITSWSVPSRVIFSENLQSDLTPNFPLQLGILEFHMNASEVAAALSENEGWKELTMIQRSICHLTYRGVRGAEISEHFGYSKGHYYNERSTIRKKLGIPADVDLNLYLQNVVKTHG